MHALQGVFVYSNGARCTSDYPTVELVSIVYPIKSRKQICALETHRPLFQTQTTTEYWNVRSLLTLLASWVATWLWCHINKLWGDSCGHIVKGHREKYRGPDHARGRTTYNGCNHSCASLLLAIDRPNNRQRPFLEWERISHQLQSMS